MESAGRRCQRLAQLSRAAGGFSHQEADIRLGGHELHALADELNLPGYIPVPAQAREFPVRVRGRDHPFNGADDFRIAEGVERACPAFSFGVAQCPEEATELDQLVQLADTRLYEAKEAKR